MRNLTLNVKKKWFDMIAFGVKKEEYREIKKYWKDRLLEPVFILSFKEFDTVTFKNGYSKNAPTMVVEFKGIDIGNAVPEWSDNWQGKVFVIKLGKVITKHNC